MHKKITSFERRKRRVRFKLKKVSFGKLRLSVFKSNSHIYAQIIDDAVGKTVVSASSNEKSIKANNRSVNKVIASQVGRVLAERAVSKEITHLVFDRGGSLYHGRIKALADGAKAAGLKF